MEEGGVGGIPIDVYGANVSSTAPENWHCNDRKLLLSDATSCEQINLCYKI